MIVYEYVSRRSRKASREWGLDHAAEAKFDAKLDQLAQTTLEMAVDSILIRVEGRLLKLRFSAGKAFRPRFCRGPKNPESDTTFLLGVTKSGSKRSPSNPNNLANQRLDELEQREAKLAILREDQSG